LNVPLSGAVCIGAFIQIHAAARDIFQEFSTFLKYPRKWNVLVRVGSAQVKALPVLRTKNRRNREKLA
jgi:hypothetical protein